MPLAASMTDLNGVNLDLHGEGEGRIEHNKLNPRIEKGHWRGRQSTRRKS